MSDLRPMPNKLTPLQAEVLARLTDKWRPEWNLVGRQTKGRLSGNHATLKALVVKGYAQAYRRYGHMSPEYRLLPAAGETA